MVSEFLATPHSSSGETPISSPCWIERNALRVVGPLPAPVIHKDVEIDVRADPGCRGRWPLLVPGRAPIAGQGQEAIPVSLPAGDDSAGWKEYADAAADALGDRTGVIVVAQSLGGFSAPLVCERVPVKLLVLLNAMIPAPGETGGGVVVEHRTGRGDA